MNTIRKLKNIKACDQAKEFVYLHREQIKKAALPLTVVAAVLFFWFFSLHEEPASKEAQPAGEGGEQTQTLPNSGQTAEQAARIYVDISGCVKEPGVYEVSEGTRVFQLIEEANPDSEQDLAMLQEQLPGDFEPEVLAEVAGLGRSALEELKGYFLSLL